ncbi:MAG: Hpt domain-containing protein [Chloroflexi bacterium]|nr:Hpt domain-containing protein [Chloroflexota bacterium]
MDDAIAAEAAKSVLNVEALDQIRALDEPGRPSLLAEMVLTFRTSMSTYVARLKAAATDGNSEAMAEAAHALKGAAACIGAEHVSAVAFELERGGHQNSLAGCEQRITALEVAGEHALAALSQELARAA